MGDIRIGDLVVINIPKEKAFIKYAFHQKVGIIVGMTTPNTVEEEYEKVDICLNLTYRLITVSKDVVILKATPEQHPELFI